MTRKGRSNSIRDSEISWPVESCRDEPDGAIQPAKVRRVSMSWPLDSKIDNIDGNQLSLAEREFLAQTTSTASAYETPSCSKRSGSPISTNRAMSLASILREPKGSVSCSRSVYLTPEEAATSSKLPSPKAWELAGDVQLLDSSGNSRTFRSLYSGLTALGDQQLVIFVRHFFCSACQEYLKTLSSSLTLATYLNLPIPTSIIVIGLGSPELLQRYRRLTDTPFALFTDPTRKLYKYLGMSWSLNFGPRPAYFNKVNEMQWIWNQCVEMKKAGKDLRFKGGAWIWIGGEFLIRNEKAIWCHRMQNYRDHTDVGALKKLLGAEEE